MPIYFVVSCNCWPNKSFLPFLVLREWQKTALPRMAELPPSLNLYIFINYLYISSNTCLTDMHVECLKSLMNTVC